jgi:lipopolysaccharide export LptBFGC system permease protein LptF
MTDKPEQPSIDTPGKKSDELASAYERAAFHLVPKAFFPFFAAFFVLLCGAMAVMLFAVGKIFGGLLFSFVVLVGLYIVYNKISEWRGAPRDIPGGDSKG